MREATVRCVAAVCKTAPPEANTAGATPAAHARSTLSRKDFITFAKLSGG